MNLTHAFSRSTRPVLCALAIALFTLPGCQGRKVVARVNSETINEDDFTARALRVTTLNPQTGLDAGGLTLVNMVKENLVLQLAKNKGITLTDDQVNQYVAIMEKLNPQIMEGIHSGKLLAEDVAREYRMEMLLFALGTDNAKADPKELQATYDKHKQELTLQASYRLRLMLLQDPSKAQQALAEVKKSGDFKQAAIVSGSSPEAVRETSIPVLQAPPALKASLDALKPLGFTPEPIALPLQTGQVYLIAQLLEKTTDHTLTLEESRIRVERMALEDKFPQWGQHADTAINDFITQSKDNIQINIDRYKNLKEQFILPKPKPVVPAGAPSSPTGAAPGMAPNAPATAGSPTEAPQVGGAAPPSGATTPAPTTGGKK